LAQQQLHPSLIFSGDDGVGKRLLAMQLALALNCLDSSLRPCERCQHCVKGAAGTHPDLTVVEPTEGRRAVNIAQVRTMIADMGRKPFEGKRRVFILTEADRLREDAMNALLKSLEEPPGTTLTILITARPSMLIPTIHSRCQHLRLATLTEHEIVEVLTAQGLDKEDARDRARFGAGRPGQALSEDARTRADDALLLLNALAQGRAARDPMGVAADLLASLDNQRAGIGQFCEWLLRALRDLLFFVSINEAPATAMAPFAHKAVTKIAPNISLMNVRKAIASVEKTQFGMQRNLNVKLEIEGLIIALSKELKTL
jgi:DNA polymerase-3 subunit delta'